MQGTDQTHLLLRRCQSSCHSIDVCHPVIVKTSPLHAVLAVRDVMAAISCTVDPDDECTQGVALAVTPMTVHNVIRHGERGGERDLMVHNLKAASAWTTCGVPDTPLERNKQNRNARADGESPNLALGIPQPQEGQINGSPYL